MTEQTGIDLNELEKQYRKAQAHPQIVLQPKGMAEVCVEYTLSVYSVSRDTRMLVGWVPRSFAGWLWKQLAPDGSVIGSGEVGTYGRLWEFDQIMPVVSALMQDDINVSDEDVFSALENLS